MLFKPSSLSMLAQQLTSERKRQGLSREQAAAVCSVSPSFIRDAETDPARCSLGRLLQYMTGLGLSMDVTGWSHVQVQTDFPTDSQDAESKKP
jgi:transcriptional regulator with XRE-family HTH domain